MIVSGALLAGALATMGSAMADDAAGSTKAPASEQTAGVTTQDKAAASTGTQSAQISPAATTGSTQAEKTPTPAKASTTAEQKLEQDWLKVSDDAMASMYDVYKARHAIFNGEPVQAVTFLDAATTRINATAQDAGQYDLDINAPKSDDDYVPFNANLTVVDDFEPTDTNAAHIAKSNTHLQKGDQKAAIEELKLSEIDAAITVNLIPVNFARKQITMAAGLARKGQFYEANLALKAVDDSVITRMFDLSAKPKDETDAGSKPPAKAGS